MKTNRPKTTQRPKWKYPTLHDETSHWQCCAGCGTELTKYNHRSSCITPGVCAECGATCDPGTVQHVNVDWQTFEHDENYCWHVCADCGAEVQKLEHSALCSNPGYCGECGFAYNGNNISHVGIDWDNWKHDETSHWRICTECGEIVDLSVHYNNCTDTEHCALCGAEYTGSFVNHWGIDSDNLMSDANYHWYYCFGCGQEVKYQHFNCCTDTEHCALCGVEYTGSHVNHWGLDWDNPMSDANYHWYYCSDCNQEVEKYEHFNRCTDTEHCA